MRAMIKVEAWQPFRQGGKETSDSDSMNEAKVRDVQKAEPVESERIADVRSTDERTTPRKKRGRPTKVPDQFKREADHLPQVVDWSASVSTCR
jgi:hypothetical protein